MSNYVEILSSGDELAPRKITAHSRSPSIPLKRKSTSDVISLSDEEIVSDSSIETFDVVVSASAPKQLSTKSSASVLSSAGAEISALEKKKVVAPVSWRNLDNAIEIEDSDEDMEDVESLIKKSVSGTIKPYAPRKLPSFRPSKTLSAGSSTTMSDEASRSTSLSSTSTWSATATRPFSTTSTFQVSQNRPRSSLLNKLDASFDDAMQTLAAASSTTNASASSSRFVQPNHKRQYSSSSEPEAVSRPSKSAKGKAKAITADYDSGGNQLTATNKPSTAAEKKALAQEKKRQKELEKQQKLAYTKANIKIKDKNIAVKQIVTFFPQSSTDPSSPFYSIALDLQKKLIDRESHFEHYVHKDNQSCVIGDGAVLMFKRESNTHQVGRHFEMNANEEVIRTVEDVLIVYLPAKDLAARIQSNRLESLIQDIKDLSLSGKSSEIQTRTDVFIFIHGLTNYYKKKSRAERADYAAGVRAGMGGGDINGGGSSRGGAAWSDVGKEEVERALVKLQLAERCFLNQVDKDQDLVDAMYSMIADLGLKPYKLIEQSHLSFMPEKIKSGIGPEDTFHKMLLQIPGVSIHKADAICSVYKTMGQLQTKYDECEVTGEADYGRLLLDRIQIVSSNKGAVTDRTIGKAMSRKIYDLMRGGDTGTVLEDQAERI